MVLDRGTYYDNPASDSALLNIEASVFASFSPVSFAAVYMPKQVLRKSGKKVRYLLVPKKSNWKTTTSQHVLKKYLIDCIRYANTIYCDLWQPEGTISIFRIMAAIKLTLSAKRYYLLKLDMSVSICCCILHKK